ncbi:MAG TPA: ATP-dependent Clp protease proteolytic subunit [Methanothrix sp.]|nr:ATP-dependent Clp protease proteolytic subunit [Methanothrix sp.]HPT19432.1 ATP-dependent Clp protease proteolytic subunit [Methanothrix sp.]
MMNAWLAQTGIDAGALMNNLWFILFILLFLVPMMQRYYLQAARKTVLGKLGKKRGTTVITLIHRQETISFLGIPLARYIDIDDSERVLRAIRAAQKDVPIDIILHTPGGLALAATQIAMALKAHPSAKTVIVPHYAMSGGTLIAFAADKIIMDPHAALGPVDPQLGDAQGSYPATSLLQVVGKKKIDEIDDKTLIYAEEAKKAMQQMKALLAKILEGKCGGERLESIAEEFVSGKYTHDHPFMAEQARVLLGECVQTDVPAEVYALMDLYRMEAGRSRPGVEYVPLMRR